MYPESSRAEQEQVIEELKKALLMELLAVRRHGPSEPYRADFWAAATSPSSEEGQQETLRLSKTLAHLRPARQWSAP